MNSPNRPTNIVIFGSCVSRDIFRLCDKDGIHFHINHYFARSSIVSAMSKPLKIYDNDVQLDSAFQRRMVLDDFHKTFRKQTKRNEYDLIIIDFIDERYALQRIKNSYVTVSTELVNSGFRSKYPEALVPMAKKEELWQKNLPQFVKLLEKPIAQGKVFLHKAFWGKEYYDVQNGGAIVPYDDNRIETQNKILQKYYDSFIRSAGEKLKVAECDNNIGTSDHLWGCSPIHYSNSYYETIYRQIASSVEGRIFNNF
jgi:hypothetical protein